MKTYNYYEYLDINQTKYIIFVGNIYKIHNRLFLVSDIYENNIKFAELSVNSYKDGENGNHDVIRYFSIAKDKFLLKPEAIITNWVLL